MTFAAALICFITPTFFIHQNVCNYLTYMSLQFKLKHLIFNCLLDSFLPWPQRLSGHGHVATLYVGDSVHHLTEQMRTNMFKPGQRVVTAEGGERHVLQTLWIRKDI